MLDADESAELRALQAAAYGRDGELSPSDAARLRELESRRAAPAAAAPSVADAAGRVVESSGAAGEPYDPFAEPDGPSAEGVGPAAKGVGPVAEGDGPAAEPVEASGTPVAASSRLARWRQSLLRPWPAAAASALVLAVGIGVGWLLFGFNFSAYALAIAHSAQATELDASGDYDPGSVVALTEQHGAVLWSAQRDGGEQECLILTSQEQTASDCQPSELIDDMGAMYVSLQLPSSGESVDSLSATLIRSPDGELIPIVQMWSPEDYDWRSQYTADELEIIDLIEEEGFEGSALNLLGYDGDSPVWLSWEAVGLCVIAEADDGIAHHCGDSVYDDVVLSAVVDGVPTDYVVQQNEQRGAQLTVVKPMDAMSIDDKTGEITEYSFDDLTQEPDS